MTSPSLQSAAGQAAVATVDRARESVREHLRNASHALARQDLPRPDLDGKLLRPLSAYLIVPEARRPELDTRFWFGALAIEMVHEASLLHDDILDQAPERRGRPTMAARAGVGPALVLGDHLLTAAYRAAAQAGSTEFLQVFIQAVERTVAGEIAQEKRQGKILDEEEYARIVTGKSGELFRAAFSLAPILLNLASPRSAGQLGARLGLLYQRIDDILDYCTHADRGKVPLQDLRQSKWTWPLGLASGDVGNEPAERTLERLFGEDPSTGRVPMEEGARRIQEDARALVAELDDQGLESTGLATVLSGWAHLVEEGVRREVELRREPARKSRGASQTPGDPALEEESVRRVLRGQAAFIGDPQDRLRYFGHHSKSFRFASRWFDRERLQDVADVYAFCRFTDDLVDEDRGEDAATRRARLQEWGRMAQEAYEGRPTQIPLLDQVMGTMRIRGVPFRYARELIRGVGMDLDPAPFRSLPELRTYSHRVASVVGEWITELFGIDDPWMLERARALGHAMQMTNILRDVGEDLQQGRIYLPEDRMAAHGVDRRLLEAKMAEGAPALPGYRDLLEELMAEAEADYDRAFQAIPRLPRYFRAAVAVAASVYGGIHAEIRKNGYDNLNRRARTSLLTKVRLAAGGLWRIRREKGSRSRVRAWRTVFFLLPALLLAAPARAQDSHQARGGRDDGLSAAAVPWAEAYLDRLEKAPPSEWTESEIRLEKVRALYYLAVEEGDWAHALADSLDRALAVTPEASQDRVPLAGYRGALEVARARHARWPPNKLKHLNRGAQTLDSLVALHPDHVETRYLRFASYRFLPFFLDRDETVAEDARILAQGLIARPEGISLAVYRNMVGFLLSYESLDDASRTRLTQVISRHP